jgi:hypothetical protein
MKTNFYYYDPDTGNFKFRSNVKNDNLNLPYIEREEGWNYSEYRVDVPFTALIHTPIPTLQDIRNSR